MTFTITIVCDDCGETWKRAGASSLDIEDMIEELDEHDGDADDDEDPGR